MNSQTPTHESSSPLSENSEFLLKSAAVTGVIALGIGALASAQSGEKTAPTEDKSYVELAADSAKEAYDPTKDTLVINGIKIMPNNPNRNSPSQAVLNHPEVQEYVAANSDEASSIEASSLALNTFDTDFAIVERDIDGDGDTDAVAVPVKK